MAHRKVLDGCLQILLAVSLALTGLPLSSAHDGDLPVLQNDGHGDGVEDDGFWNVVTGFATKNGYRMVFAWDSDQPIMPLVEWGFSAGNLDHKARPAGDAADTAGIVFLDTYERPNIPQIIVHYRFTDESDGAFNGGVAPPPSPTKSFPLTNALGNRFDTNADDDGIYEANLVIALDSEALPDDVPFDLGLEDVLAGVDVLAERVWDYSDGYLRIARVLVMDRLSGYPTGVADSAQNQVGGSVYAQGEPLPCNLPSNQANDAQFDMLLPDVVIQTTVPFDSHTWKDTADGPVIQSPCLGISIGRDGWLYANPWGVSADVAADLGATLAHEFGHYALNLDDLYPSDNPVADQGADCWEGTSGRPGQGDNWDISVMHNGFGWDGERWVGSELDGLETPCDWGLAEPSWSIFTQWYPKVPLLRNGDGRPDHYDSDYETMRGNPDGGALEAYVLDREPGLSKLRLAIVPPVADVPPEPSPRLVIEYPSEGDAFHVDRIDIQGTVERGYPDLPLTVEAGGPYTVTVHAEAILVATAANGVGPYHYEWSTTGPGTFSDPNGAVTQVVFTQEGTYQLSVTAFDKGSDPFQGSSIATDTALILVNPTESPAGPPGCPPLSGQQLATDPKNDAQLGMYQNTPPLSAELTCLGAELHLQSIVPMAPVSVQENAVFTFQLGVLDRQDVDKQYTSYVFAATDDGVFQTYLIGFTPDFGSDLRKNQPQWIFLKWDRTPDAVSNKPVDVLTACFLVLPPGNKIPPPPNVDFRDYDQDCDPTRSVTASWVINTLEIDFDLWREIGTPGAGDQFKDAVALSYSRFQNYPLRTTQPAQFIQDTYDTVPDGPATMVTFDGPRDLRPQPSAPVPQTPQLPGSAPLPSGSPPTPGVPVVTDPPLDSALPFFDILEVGVDADFVGTPTNSFTLTMKVADLQSGDAMALAVDPPSGILPPPINTLFGVGLETDWEWNFCLDTYGACYTTVARHTALGDKGETMAMGGPGWCELGGQPVKDDQAVFSNNEIRVTLLANHLDVKKSAPRGQIDCRGHEEGGQGPRCGSKLTSLNGMTDMWVTAVAIKAPVGQNLRGVVPIAGRIVADTVFDWTDTGSYTFCQSDFRVEAGPPLPAVRGQQMPMAGSASGGLPAYSCTWSAPGATFQPDPADPTGCFLILATFQICDEIPVTLTGRDALGNMDSDPTFVTVTGAGCDETPTTEYIEVYATPILPSSMPSPLPTKIATLPMTTNPAEPRAYWGTLWQGLTEEHNGYWNITAKWFDLVQQGGPLAQDTVNVTIGLARLTGSLEEGATGEDGPPTLPGTEDADHDGLSNDVDNCPLVPNLQQADLDEDGFGDACDEDADGDGWRNFLDNCAMTPDPSLHDEDQDRKGDACDDDDDNDGIKDGRDNCVLDKNPDQADLDDDGFGDVCDDDRDGDGAPDVLDHFPDNPAEWIDFDHDALGDNADPDDDQDGIKDTEETNAAARLNAAHLNGLGRSPANVEVHEDNEAPGFGSLAALLAIALAALTVARRRR
ncbi:MAG TPA: thrombospondin type 3 repeat-containing protein [Candidatus Thermoplasmatota archaeon]|nr:thrombospondin type 3 repeat-containing protein [Candidatus Thermoplasmatota archaeon]